MSNYLFYYTVLDGQQSSTNSPEPLLPNNNVCAALLLIELPRSQNNPPFIFSTTFAL